MNALYSYLHHHPDAAADELRGRAKIVAKKLGVAAGVAETIWREELRDRGVVRRAGRHSLEARHKLVEYEMGRSPRGPTGRLASGFWAHAALLVSEAEDVAMDAVSLRVWYYAHLKRCASGIG